MSHDEMAAIMGEWNKGELDSFLIEISANILKYKDTDGEPLVEKIRDAAGQKGTGKWTAISALGKIKYYAPLWWFDYARFNGWRILRQGVPENTF